MIDRIPGLIPESALETGNAEKRIVSREFLEEFFDRLINRPGLQKWIGAMCLEEEPTIDPRKIVGDDFVHRDITSTQ